MRHFIDSPSRLIELDRNGADSRQLHVKRQIRRYRRILRGISRGKSSNIKLFKFPAREKQRLSISGTHRLKWLI